jgi:hypothetical protein
MAKKKKPAGVTKEDLELFEFVVRFVEGHSYQPTRAEIGRHFGLDKKGVAARVRRLVEGGYLGWNASKERAMFIRYVRCPVTNLEGRRMSIADGASLIFWGLVVVFVGAFLDALLRD